MRFRFTYIIILSFCSCSALCQVRSSVLQSGDWYKIGILDRGIYKIDRSFLEGIGVTVSSIDPKNIAIYGNGGNGMLPQSNAEFRHEDLVENSISVQGETDGSFDASDYLLFFGNAPDFVEYNHEDDFFSYEKNLYSDTTFYFITIKESPGLRVSQKNSIRDGLPKVTSFKGVNFHEVDETNLIQGGRMWFGELFSSSNTTQTISFPATDFKENGEIKIGISVMAQGFSDSSFDIGLNGLSLGNISINDVPNSTYSKKGDLQYAEFATNSSLLNNTDGLALEVKYNSASSTGFLNYIVIQTEKELRQTGKILSFYNTSGLNKALFELSNSPTDLNIWDVTNHTNPVNLEFNMSGDKASFSTDSSQKEFMSFVGSDFPFPISSLKVKNQNLHSLSSADALFITHDKFRSQANDLKKHRELMMNQQTGNDFSVHVVTVNEIYNEFSSGMQDISAIRDFVKYIYDKNPEKLKYLLLFGDCSYDYKNRSIENTNYVPVYEARNSLHPLYNFSSDDFFGFMEDHEGNWEENKAGDHTLEIGIGRLPVKTEVEAGDVVNKIIRYETSINTFGKWRNEMLFIADDGDNNIHQRDANFLADYVESTREEFNVDRLFIDAYEQISSPSGQSSPSAKKAFEEAIEDGKLMINYTGHGNEAQLTVEKIIDEIQISELKNRTRLPFFITATCEFGNYDNPNRVSGGEKTLLNPNGGAIALLTSTRPVFSNTNFILNQAYYYAAMEKIDGQFPRLGDIIKNTKNNSLEGVKNRNFALLGDPTLKLSFPKYDLAITSVNGKIINQADTLKALSKIFLQGEVRRSDQSIVDDFSGIVSVTIFDKPTQFSTLGNENTSIQQFDQREALLFNGEASVKNGLFSIEFIVPKNISYVFGKGKISMYALNDDPNLPVDANGSNIDLKVGGSNPNALSDNTPPQIELFLNDMQFQPGQATSPNPLLLAKLSDESGINISNQGFGQNITISIDGGTEFIINEFYSAIKDTYQKGLVSYPLNNLEPGKHSIILVAHDTHNNSASATMEFVISDEFSISLSDISAYPNPYDNNGQNITFTFSHDREGEELDVRLEIINLQGRVILENQYRFEDSFNQVNSIKWGLTESNGNKLDPGIYIYRISIQSTLDGAKNQAHKKLIILN
jgi:hypothetical protein